MESRGVGLEDILRVFTACQYDARTLLLDLRDFKTYKKLHVMQSFNVRLAANGKALLVWTFGPTWPLSVNQMQASTERGLMHMCRTIPKTLIAIDGLQTVGECAFLKPDSYTLHLPT